MKAISEQEQRILDVLIFENKIPKDEFQISEDSLVQYMHAYVNVLRKQAFKLDSSDYRYARKLAGLTLLKYNLALGMQPKIIKSGFVYIIENSTFPEHYKIGMCVDLESRLQSYQTYDPYRSFRIVKYEFVLDRRFIEKRILNSFRLSLEQGEWILKKNAETVFRKITSSYEKVSAT